MLHPGLEYYAKDIDLSEKVHNPTSYIVGRIWNLNISHYSLYCIGSSNMETLIET